MTDRDTCKCVVHENMSLLVDKLFNKKVIEQNSPNQLCKDLSCESEHLKEKCLERQCNVCEHKKITILSSCVENDTITYLQWVTKKVPITVKGVENQLRKNLPRQIRNYLTSFKHLF